MFQPEEDALERYWISKLFLSEKFADCSILVKTKDSIIRFPCHKIVISMASDVIAGILEGSSDGKGGAGVLIMEDFHADAVEKILEYAYLGRLDIKGWKLAIDVLKIAIKYEIRGVFRKCEEILLADMNLQNVCYILQFAILNKSERVEEECVSVCRNGGFVVLNTKGFREANLDTVKKILSIVNIRKDNELAAFRAAYRWATYRCCKEQKALSDENIASQMTPILEDIGFQNMSEAEMGSIYFRAMFQSEEDALERDWKSKLFLSEKFADCSILVKTKDSIIRFPCHKIVISLASDVIAGILEGSSDGKGGAGVLIMEDVDADAVEKILEYAYLGRLDIKGWKLAIDVLNIAVKYEIRGVFRKCEEILLADMNLQNVCYILQFAILNKFERLEEECVSVCGNVGFVVLNTSGFREADLDTVKKILSIPNMQIENELAAFRAAWRWATYRCCKEQKALSDENIASQMTPLLESIGFRSISEAEMGSIPKVVLDSLCQLFPAPEKYHKYQRTIGFPISLDQYTSKFKFDVYIDNIRMYLQGHGILLKFCVDTPVYLTGVGIEHELPKYKFDQCAKTFLYVCSSRETLIETRVSYGSYSPEKKLKRFVLVVSEEILLLKFYKEYTVEVKRGFGDVYLTFPPSSLVCKRMDGIGISVCSTECYGVSRLELLKAS